MTMFPDDKEYYPLEIAQIISRNGDILYDRNERKKPYVYIVIENIQDKGE